MSWAPRDTFGYSYKFEDIQASRFEVHPESWTNIVQL